MIRAASTISREGFRLFFLVAGAFAIFAMLVWTIRLGVQAMGGEPAEMPFLDAPHLWHAHEMVFGYASAALAGFFLTAAPNWTGGPAAQRTFLVALALIWLAGRMVIWWSGTLPSGLVAAVDLLFMPLLGLKLAVMLTRRPKPQNVMLLGLLLLIWSGNVLMHLEWTGVIGDGVERGLRVGLFGFAAVIAVIGGRVTPAFTRNAMIKEGLETGLPVTRNKVEKLGVVSAIALPVSIAIGSPDLAVAAVAILAGLAQAFRLARWRGAWTRFEPLLWSLHLGFGMLALGYLAFGLAMLGYLDTIAALHVTGIGAVGGMTLAVMSRAILGHTGRALRAPALVALAFTLILASAVLRALASLGGPYWRDISMLSSGGMWVLAFAAFLIALWPAISSPRLPPSRPQLSSRNP